MLMSVRYRWTGDVDETRLWVRELYTSVYEVYGERTRQATPVGSVQVQKNKRSDEIFAV